MATTINLKNQFATEELTNAENTVIEIHDLLKVVCDKIFEKDVSHNDRLEIAKALGRAEGLAFKARTSLGSYNDLHGRTSFNETLAVIDVALGLKN